MAVAPGPSEIYRRAEDEGARRLDMPALERVSTAFIAGVTIVFGIVALGVVEALVEPRFGTEVAQLLGALAFGIGLVFTVVGRSELFSENFFGPVATAIDRGLRSSWLQLLRLWVVVLVLNLVGGAVLVLVVSVEGTLPHGAPGTLEAAASAIADKTVAATLARAVLAGALLTLLSYLLHAVGSVLARIAVAYMVGFLVAIGPFDHVVVSALHLLLGVRFGDTGFGDVGVNIAVSTVGNVAGGLLLITLTHTAQVKGARGDA